RVSGRGRDPRHRQAERDRRRRRSPALARDRARDRGPARVPRADQGHGDPGVARRRVRQVTDPVETQIREIVDRETRAWDTQDVDLLLTIFHPDFVWVWPSRSDAHDPAEWKIGMGRFDPERWRREYQALFDAYELVGNDRETVKIEVAGE